MNAAEIYLVVFGAVTALTTIGTVVFKAGGQATRLDLIENRLHELEQAFQRAGINVRQKASRPYGD